MDAVSVYWSLADANCLSRYANKLVPEKGLALSVFDILTAEDGKVTWGNGLMYYKGKYRLSRSRSSVGNLHNFSVFQINALRTFCWRSHCGPGSLNHKVLHSR